ncbi:hypothetical protein EZV62_017939 [Acer yangbiense]|uniref:Uncharacterized protein n=1 Tax=Acer yangbiense TaxID=1000413 RepID=A0A5C7HK65_9ROSI|nr:hypothetical protein EZV62_017939 [Acer yangbiense]
MGTKFEVEKFTGENDFGLWKMKMKAMLVKEGLDIALDGEEKLPTDMKADEKKNWLKKAYSSLILGLGDKVLREVSKETTATGVWEKLEELYVSKTVPDRIYLKQRLFGFKMLDQRSMTDNMDDFRKIIQDLEGMYVTVDDEDQAVILLNSLPERYKNFVETIKYGRQTFKLSEVQAAITAKDAEIRAGEKKANDAEGKKVKKLRTDNGMKYLSDEFEKFCRENGILDDGVEIEVEFADKQGTDSLQPATDQVDDALDSEEAYEDQSELTSYQLVRDRVRRDHKAPSRDCCSSTIKDGAGSIHLSKTFQIF